MNLLLGGINVTSVDQNRLCTVFIKKTSRLLNTEINVVQSDSINFLRKNNSQFHLIFADPPYEIQHNIYKIIIDLSVEKLLTNGMLVIEHNKKIDFSNEPSFI